MGDTLKTTTMAAVLALACAGMATAGCNTNKNKQRTAEARERVGEVREEVGIAVDSMDAVMRYQVSSVDMKTSELVLVPVELAEQEIDPQSGQELRLTFSEFRELTGKTEPDTGDVIQSLEEGGEVIIHSKRLGMPNSADDIDRIELPAKD